MSDYFPALPPVSNERTKTLEAIRQTFKQHRMQTTGVGVYWTPELAAKKGSLQVDSTTDWQSPRVYAAREILLKPSRLLFFRDHYARDVLAISMRGAETWLLEYEGKHYIFKQDPRTDSYQYEKTALLRLNSAYSDTIDGQRFPQLIDWDDEQQILITSYLPGETLDTIDAVLAPDYQKISWIKDIAIGLDRLHDIGIAHFDLAPRKCKLLPTGIGLIDYGSCGLGDDIELVRLGHLRNTANPEGPRFHRAPELTEQWTVNGERAERYGLARIIYWLIFGSVDPLIESSRKTGFSIDTDMLRTLTTRLTTYNTDRDKPLLDMLISNFSRHPSQRIHSSHAIIDCLNERLHGSSHEPQDFHPLLISEYYRHNIASIRNEPYILVDCDKTLFSFNIHNYTLTMTDLAHDPDEAMRQYNEFAHTPDWKSRRKALYRRKIDATLAKTLDIETGYLSDEMLYVCGAQAAQKIYDDTAYTAETFHFLRALAADKGRIIVVSGSPRPIVAGVLETLVSILNIDLSFTIFGTEYTYTEGQPLVLIEGYAATKRLIAQYIYDHGGTIPYGIGDSLSNDAFLVTVDNHGGEAILIHSEIPHDQQWKELYQNFL